MSPPPRPAAPSALPAILGRGSCGSTLGTPRRAGAALFAAAATGAFLAGAAVPTPARAAAPAAVCESLAAASVSALIPDTRITAAQVVGAGSFTPPGGGTPVAVATPVCRVAGVVSTQPGEQVGIEVWLPLQGWNERFQGLGSGGFGGAINYAALSGAAGRGFAAANTDTGHTGSSVGVPGQPLPWAQNPVTLQDWGRTSVHLMTRSARAILHAFYGRDPAYAYFDGCSTGGAEAMEEAEFYPEDYDGIHAGTPGHDYSHLMESFLWGALLPARNPAAALDAPALQLLNTAVLQACGGPDAVQAGYLLDPRSCSHDPALLQCQAGQDSGTCLSPVQVAQAQHLYSPVTNPRTGQRLYPGFVRGSESQWAMIQGALALYFAQPLLANTVFGNPGWDWTTFDDDKDAALVDRVLSPAINATSPDLARFQMRGGKLLMTQGWADPFAAQTLPIDYYNSVVAVQGSLPRTRGFFRLFMAPGMGHCGGGPGPNTLGAFPGNAGYAPPVASTPERDTIAALQAWVEQDEPPRALISTKYVDDTPPAVAREIKLCPYPEVAWPAGNGDPAQAASYVCVTDNRQFALDFEEELRRVLTDLRSGNLANLPN